MNEINNKTLVPINLSLPHFPSSREKNKIIISNMASVLNSVKRKDKKYKKRRKSKCNINSTTCDELDDIHFISNGLTNNLKFISPKQNHLAPDDKKDDINIDNLNNTASKTKAEQITLINNNDITPIKNNVIKLNDVSSTDNEINSSSINQKTAKQNAFEVMMNARKKSIGANSPGKNEINELSFENEEDAIRKSEKAKRKRKLEEWAEQKGSKKRKLQDTTALLYIEKQLDNRKKHFKQLLKNGKPQQQKQIDDNINSKNNNINTKYKRNKNTKANNKLVNNTDSIISIEEEDIEIINSTICKNTTKENISSVTKSIEIVTDKNEISKKTKASVVDTNDFLDKLSSPIKKRDSLFGYFDKISPSLTTDTKIVEEISPKYKAVKLKTKNNENHEENEKLHQIDDVQQLPEQKKQITPTKTERPRRECSKRIQSYKFDITPEKKIMQQSIRKAKKILSKSPTQHKTNKLQQQPQQINITNNNKFAKLAPIFNKTIKPIIDLSILTARQQFLMSGIPEKMKQELLRQKTFEEQYEFNLELFPLISHITQLQSNDDLLKTATIENIKLNKLLLMLYVDKDDNKQIEIVPFKNIKLLNNSELLTKYYQNIKMNNNNNTIAKLNNVKLLLKNLKINFGTFPINRCYKQLNKKYLNNNNTYNDDNDAADDDDNSCQIISDNCFNNNNGQETFTEKYKPLISNEFFINSKSINQLKDFLINWKLKQKRNSSDDDDDDDDDYFENTNSSSNLNSQQHMNNAIVLLGPSGCGKTNAVYAIANELNFNVIELNASNIRTGKKIVKQLQEATKSHLIGSNENEKYSTTTATVTTNSSNNNSDSVDENLDDNKKLSLILIEDADCVFEQDIGFIDAINQLILTSKRPVILIANNANCAHLLKLQQNLIKFKCGNVHNTVKWLLLLAINENYFINIYSLEKLYLYNNCDLRKTILDVQFYIQSNGDYNYINQDDRVQDNDVSLENTASHYNHRKLFEYFTYSQNYLHKINQIPICRPIDLKLIDFCKYSTEIYSNYHKQQQLIKEKSPKSIENVKDDEHLFFDNILNFYDNITTAIQIHDRTIQDGITNKLQNDIIYELIDNTFLQQNLQWNNDNYTFVNDNNKNKSSGTLLTNIISDNFYDKQSINLDYEPSLRSICRSEKNRSICDRTGTKRFYHYFRNSNGLSFSTNIFDEQCNFFS